MRSILGFITVLISGTLALPWPADTFFHPAAPHQALQKRGLPGAVYLCTDQNFRGECGWTPPSPGCHISGTGEDAPESIGPDPGGYCILYKNQKCDSTQLKTLQFPGIGSGIPSFGSLACYAYGSGPGAANAASGSAPIDVQGTKKKLAGGVGSLAREAVKGQMEAMEADGFSEGFIGLRKKEYY